MPFKGLIFDLDETLVNTTCLKNFRDSGNWRSCFSNIHRTELYPFVEELLTICRELKLKIGVVTMSPRNYAKQVLKHHNIKYDYLVAYRDVTRRKPDPEPMLKCASGLELNPEDILSIGDDLKDVLASKRAGMYSIGVSWGVANKDKLIANGADIVVDSFKDIFSLIK
ncbi:HAD family hydrolase [Neobacillus terrae]|uniref:HAD family hydrolase n=1 Tax=Neobacillus terrae TaxID=3034837 RepID=UPI001407C908|nr:HAD family hydrolase [Neobacillus terrae]NHM31284.1 HAD family hydrolase [Neobacillus terrae]